MRTQVSLFAVFVSIMLVAACFASLPPVTDGLVGCWNFDQGSLVTAMDMSGNGNDGTMMNTTYADPPPGTTSTASLFFNNTKIGPAYSYVTIPDSPSLRPNSSITLAAWVKTPSLQYRACIIIGKQYGAGVYYDSYNLWYEWNEVNFYIKGQIGENRIHVAQPSVNQWHHIVATYNGALMTLYIDGVQRVNGTYTQPIWYEGNNPVTIGADSDRADHTLEQGWDGYIDEVLIYNRSLTPAEITQIIPEFPSVLMLPLFMSAMIIGVIAYTWKRRKQAIPSFS